MGCIVAEQLGRTRLSAHALSACGHGGEQVRATGSADGREMGVLRAEMMAQHVAAETVASSTAPASVSVVACWGPEPRVPN